MQLSRLIAVVWKLKWKYLILGILNLTLASVGRFIGGTVNDMERVGWDRLPIHSPYGDLKITFKTPFLVRKWGIKISLYCSFKQWYIFITICINEVYNVLSNILSQIVK